MRTINEKRKISRKTDEVRSVRVSVPVFSILCTVVCNVQGLFGN